MLSPDDLDPVDVPPVLKGHASMSFLDDELQAQIDEHARVRRPAGFARGPLAPTSTPRSGPVVVREE